MKRMTVGDLKQELTAFPDTAEVLVWDMGQGGLVGAYVDFDEDTGNRNSVWICAVDEGQPDN